MGYSIHYSPETEKKFPKAGKITIRVRKMLAFFFALIILVGTITLHKKGLLRELLIPGDPEITVAAMETMADNLKEGMTLQTAVEAFCMEILSHASIS